MGKEADKKADFYDATPQSACVLGTIAILVALFALAISISALVIAKDAARDARKSRDAVAYPPADSAFLQESSR